MFGLTFHTPDLQLPLQMETQGGGVSDVSQPTVKLGLTAQRADNQLSVSRSF